MAHNSSGCVCHQVQLQASQVSVQSAGSKSLESGCALSSLRRARYLCFSSCVSAGQSCNQDLGSGLSMADPHCPGMAQHALVLRPGQSFSADSSLPAPGGESVVTAVQPVSTHKDLPGLNLHTWLLEPLGYRCKGSLRKWQHKLRLLRCSTRAVCESKWSVFVKWCELNQVDVRSPSISLTADFLLHLFQEKHLQPSTIDSYRMAIADKIENNRVNISKDENITCLLERLRRARPKGRRGINS